MKSSTRLPTTMSTPATTTQESRPGLQQSLQVPLPTSHHHLAHLQQRAQGRPQSPPSAHAARQCQCQLSSIDRQISSSLTRWFPPHCACPRLHQNPLPLLYPSSPLSSNSLQRQLSGQMDPQAQGAALLSSLPSPHQPQQRPSTLGNAAGPPHRGSSITLLPASARGSHRLLSHLSPNTII